MGSWPREGAAARKEWGLEEEGGIGGGSGMDKAWKKQHIVPRKKGFTHKGEKKTPDEQKKRKWNKHEQTP